jgi:hypothetical protein
MNEPITAYPLSWPRGWKRTEKNQRQRGRFNRKEHATHNWNDGSSYNYVRSKELSVADSIERVLSELRGFGVSRENAIISTNLDVRLDGLPRSNQRMPDDAGAAVYWRRNAGEQQRCMAIDQYDRVADNLAAIAATLSAMRAIERHGGAEILNRAFEGFAALPDRAGMNWWEVLQVAKNADKESIRSAYFRLAKENHPDTGGDAEKFIVIKNAYEASQA